IPISLVISSRLLCRASEYNFAASSRNLPNNAARASLSAASRWARACACCVVHEVANEVRPPMAVPASAAKADMYAASIGLARCCEATIAHSGSLGNDKSRFVCTRVPVTVDLTAERRDDARRDRVNCQLNPRRHAVPPATDIDRCRLAGAERRNHGFPVEGGVGAEGLPFAISSTSDKHFNTCPRRPSNLPSWPGVRYVLEGSVQRSGQQIRVNAQLIDAETDTHLWAERFDREASDLLLLQDEITSRIANSLNVTLVAAEAARLTEHPDVLEYILRGRAAAYKPATRDSYAEAIAWFERALALDPGSVEAQSMLAS